MKKSFHVFFLFVLFAFFAVNAAWAANVTLQTAADGSKYAYIPSEDTDYLYISEEEAKSIAYGGTTFSVYASSKFNTLSRSLVINAPDGYLINIYGNFSGKFCHLLVNGSGGDSYSRPETGTKLEMYDKLNLTVYTLKKYKGKAEIPNFDIKVRLFPVGTITMLPADVGGTASFKIYNSHNIGQKNYNYETTAFEGDTILVTAAPENGYFLKGVEIKEGDKVLGNIPITDMDWYSDATKHTVTFTMPHANITVKPLFTKTVTADDGFFINMKFESGSSSIEKVTLTNAVKSFKLYGKDGNDRQYYEGSNNGGAFLEMVAPSGGKFEITGTVVTGTVDNCVAMGCFVSVLEKYDSQQFYQKYSSNPVGEETGIETYVSHGNDVRISFYVSKPKQLTNDRLDFTVKLLSSLTSLSENSQLDYKEVSRSEPLTIYSHMKNDGAFWYTLEARHAVGSDWSGWNVLYDKYDEHALDDHISNNYEIDHSFEIPWQNIKSNYDYMEFRYIITPTKNGNPISNEKFYTSSVKVRLKNRVNVNVKANNTTSGDYILMYADSYVKFDKDQLFDYGTPVRVQAIAPAGFKFLRWANLESENNPVTLSSVVSDTTIRALFEPKNVSEIQVVTYVSKNGDETWSSAEGSPLDVDVTSAIGGKFRVTASVVANEELCDDGNGSKNCYAYIIIRKEGSDTWDTVEAGNGAADYIKVHSGNSYTAEKERSVSYSLLKNASRFEIKTIVKPRVSSDIVIAESNSIYVNLYHTLRVNDYCYSGGSYIGSGMGEGAGSGDCNAIVEDELGNMTTLVPGETITLQYGSKLKLHPLYPYNMVFYSWKDYSKSNSEVYSYEDYITRDSVYEFTLDSNMKLLMGAKYREPDTVRVVPVGQKMPYAGMGEFGLSLSNKGTDGFRMDFASDTAFFIQKRGLSEMFAVNRLDSMFTPGEYTLTVKLINESVYYSERDSLWWCQSYPAVYWMDEFLAPNTGKNIACSEDAPAVYYRRYSFTVNDTTFNVTFNTWDDENGQYVTVGGTQKVAFGEVPTVPDEIKCPESNTEWNFSCDWASPLVAAVKDASYNFNVVRSNSTVAVSVEDGVKTATIEGAYDGDEALKITEATTVDDVVLNREFSTNGQGFSTIVLPFDFNAAALSGVKSVIEFTGMTKKGDVGMSYIWCDEEVQENIRKEAEAAGKGENYDHCNTDKANFPGDMIAYTPYMVQMEDSQIGFGAVGGITLEVTPDVAEARVGDWVFRGTTEKKVFDAEETKDGNVWGFAAKVQDAAEYVGQFVRLGAGASAQPLRAYMVFDPVSSDPPAQLVKSSKNASSAAKPAKANKSVGAETASLSDNIDVVIVSRSDKNEEHRTVIGTLTRSTGEFKMLRDYDLKGRKVNGMNKARGAYYGKKVLKK